MKNEQIGPAEQIANAMGRVYASGLTTASGGNISILDGDGSIWITPGGVDKGGLTPGDIVRVRPDGTPEGRHKPSIELPVHRMVYRARPDVRAVLHAHPAPLVAYSAVGSVPDLRLFPGALELCGGTAFAPYAPPGSPELGERTAEAFSGGANCVILENHGAAAAGGNLAEAFRAFETLEFCARLGLDASGLGGAAPLSDEELQLAAETLRRSLPEFEPGLCSEEEREARETLCGFVRRSCLRGLFTSAMGEFSIRLAGGGFLVTPEGEDLLAIEPVDLVRVEGGRREAGKRPAAMAELHARIYEAQPHVNAVALARPAGIMAFAVSGRPFDTRVIPESYALLRRMPLLPFRSAFQDTDKTAALFTSDVPAALVRSCCAITTGAGVLQAFDRLEVAEFSARAVLQAGRLGEISMMQGEKLAEIEKIFKLS